MRPRFVRGDDDGRGCAGDDKRGEGGGEKRAELLRRGAKARAAARVVTGRRAAAVSEQGARERGRSSCHLGRATAATGRVEGWSSLPRLLGRCHDALFHRLVVSAAAREMHRDEKHRPLWSGVLEALRAAVGELDHHGHLLARRVVQRELDRGAAHSAVWEEAAEVEQVFEDDLRA